MIEPRLHDVGTASMNEFCQFKQGARRNPIACHVQGVQLGARGPYLAVVDASVQKRHHLILESIRNRGAQQIDQLAFGAAPFESSDNVQDFHADLYLSIVSHAMDDARGAWSAMDKWYDILVYWTFA